MPRLHSQHSDPPALRSALALLTACLLAFLLAALPAAAQDGEKGRGIRTPFPAVPPRPPVQSYEVERVALSVDISDQRARVLLSQTVRNTGDGVLELDCLVPLPLDGAVGGLTLVADGKELAGKIYPREEALRIYEEIVSRLRDPALLEFAGHGLFRARAFPVARGASASLDLTMEYLLPKDGGRVDLDFPLANSLTQGRTVDRQEITVRIRGASIGAVFSPQDGVSVTREGDLAVTELVLEKVPPVPSFQLHYQESPGPVGGMLLSHKPEKGEDGFFLFLAEPAVNAPEGPAPPKAVVFVLDRSGSMTGTKFKQAQAALAFVLERLGPDDSFSLVDFATDVSTWRPELELMRPPARDAALKYVRSLRSGGGTNIEGALSAALGQELGDMPAYLILLTDGQPTVGETDEFKLADAARKADRGRGVRIFPFGVGEGVNARLLDRLSGGSSGQSTFVAPLEDIEDKVSAFFSKLTSPALVKPVLETVLETNRLIPPVLPDLFLGSQLAVVGRYPSGGKAVLKLAGRVGGERKTFEYPADFEAGPVANGQLIARLWAQRRAAQIIEEIDMAAGSKPNSELVDELVGLSRLYGIMTPYTSFLAAEAQGLGDGRELSRRVRENLSQLDEVAGADANWQRSMRSAIAGSAAPLAAPKPSEESARALVEMSRLDSFAGESALVMPTVIDGRAFFLKGGRLIEGSLTEDEIAALKPVKRFGPEYFELARRLPPAQMACLTQSVPVAFRFDGRNYLVETE
ncbi:MAG: VIT and VWA domain-containing protein [Deltaproteobacteria bacterium]|jgi:Ca-activated chloride channel family protein|nr:VIT and VWA domain-containing protein [Deltaproteobacteria bacterium]